MPTAPDAIITPPSAEDPPTAPVAVVEPTTEAEAPEAPGAVVGVGEATNYRLYGITNAAVNGLLFRGSGNFIKSFGRAPSGAPWWTSNASATTPASGYWVALFQLNMLAAATSTLAEIFPPAGFYAGTLAALNIARDGDGTTEDYGDAVRVDSATYVLTDISGTAKWLSYADDTDRGGTSITAGTALVVEPSAFRDNIGWGSGLAATWSAAGAVCTWKINQALNGSVLFQGAWTASAITPLAAEWGTSIYQAGTVALALSAAPSPPVAPSPIIP